MKRQIPIGMIIKQLDKALTDYTDSALARHDVTRLHWQLLNVIKDGSPTIEKILEVMQVFATKKQLETLVQELVERHWVKKDGILFSLTVEGETRYMEIAKTQNTVRETLMNKISASEYGTVIDILQKMLENLSRQRKT